MSDINDLLSRLDPERRTVMDHLREICQQHLPGTLQCIQYGMISYVIPHSTYPAGYHCDPLLALPFVALASQKHFVALYHMGLYADPHLLNRFQTSYPEYSKHKLDMGKSCIRFKYLDDVPYQLIAQLCDRMNSQQWISLYEQQIKPQK
jgi:uncharacterized protein YdhG (YjbR/CyaY superfamily)